MQQTQPLITVLSSVEFPDYSGGEASDEEMSYAEDIDSTQPANTNFQPVQFFDPTTDDLQQYKLANDQLESNLRRVSRRPFLASHARSRSTDLKSGF